MPIMFTDQQSAAVNYKGDALLIKAGAATGKTSLLVGYAKANPHLPMLYLCYNKPIQVEAQKKFPDNVKCRTGHSIAYAMCGKQLKHKLVQNLRLTDVKNFIKTPSWEVATDSLRIFNNFLSSASPSIGDEHAAFVPHMTDNQRRRKSVLISSANSIWDAAKSPTDKFPATHDVYLKLYCLQPPEMSRWFGAILFDEAQDANPVISDFVYKQKCKHIVVGDDHQQLYRWRNAENSMEAFREACDADVLVLNKSFRFGQSVADVATRLLQFKIDMVGGEPFPLEGNDKINDVVAPTLAPSLLKHRHTRLHRTVSGTLRTALKFIDKRIYWVGSIDNYNLQEVLDVYYLYSGETKEVKRKKLLTEYRSYDQYCEAAKGSLDREMLRIIKMIDEHGSTLIGKIRKLRKNAAQDETYADVVISTAHRSKGLEWETVLIEDDFIDFLADESEMEDAEIADEINLLYVASTRAMKNLQPNPLILSILRLGNKGQTPACITLTDTENSSNVASSARNSTPDITSAVTRLAGARKVTPQKIKLGK
jgi:superfamily I DNA/RNA helicase